MTHRRWIADEVSGEMAALVGDHAAHLARVLRAEIGQQFEIGTPTGVRCGTITALSDTRIEFALGQKLNVKTPPEITLALAIFKFDRMEWAIEKCTEIGVARIIPVVAHRTDSHLAAAAMKRRERWQRLARQAAEQSRRASPPEISAPIKMKDLERSPATQEISVETRLAASRVDPSSTRIVLAETERSTRLRDALQPGCHSLTLAIGPEGGWTPDELLLLRDSGWVAASLGETILRAETAAIVATALALDALG